MLSPIYYYFLTPVHKLGGTKHCLPRHDDALDGSLHAVYFIFTDVWCRRDLCLVRWLGDGQYYPAAIKRFTTDGDGNKKALVTFTGFSSDNDELVDVTSLKVPACKPPPPKTAGTVGSCVDF